MKPTASHLHAATAALLALLLSACASVAPTPPVARPAQPPSATAPTAAATPPAIAVRPPRIDRSYT